VAAKDFKNVLLSIVSPPFSLVMVVY
jgi:hypothetical protein